MDIEDKVFSLLNKDDANLDKVKSQVSQYGYVVVRGLGINELPNETLKQRLARFLEQYGSITSHNSHGFFWDIMHRGDDYVSKNTTTFSEEVGECPFHTDSSFKVVPEDFLTMYVVNPAKEGGDSLFLPVRAIVEDLKLTPDGMECLQILKRKIFPFQTPSSFDSETPIIFDHVLSEDEKCIRYRLDCIQNGIRALPDLQEGSQIKWCLAELEKVVSNSKKKVVFSAKADDLIIIDNVRGMHSRTHFEDKTRHLIRARVTEN